MSPLVDLFQTELEPLTAKAGSMDGTQVSTALEPLAQQLERLCAQHPASHALRRMLVATLEAEGTLAGLRRAIDAQVSRSQHERGNDTSVAEHPVLPAPGADESNHAQRQDAEHVDAQVDSAADLRAACLLVQRAAARDARQGAELRRHLGTRLGSAGHAVVLLEARNPQELLGVSLDAAEAVQWVAHGPDAAGAAASMPDAAPAVACALRKAEDDADLSQISRCAPGSTQARRGDERSLQSTCARSAKKSIPACALPGWRL